MCFDDVAPVEIVRKAMTGWGSTVGHHMIGRRPRRNLTSSSSIKSGSGRRVRWPSWIRVGQASGDKRTDSSPTGGLFSMLVATQPPLHATGLSTARRSFAGARERTSPRPG
jgi:hypothetical protein